MNSARLVCCAAAVAAATASASVFSPQQGSVAEVEAPFRKETSLNGNWRFQSPPLPDGYKFGVGVVPELPPADDAKWESVPIKIPCPWNVNGWGCGYDCGEGTHRPYAPDSVYFPSYPKQWRDLHQGWMERTFRIDGAASAGKRVLLHFESVSGTCRVLVNGKEAGSHFDSYLPFDLDVTDLVHPGDNVVRVGVQSHRLWDNRTSEYKHMRAPYPTGSNTEGMAGIWQDVSIVYVPEVRVDDVFVKPLVSADTLTIELALRNDGKAPATITPSAEVFDWRNLASGNVMEPEEPRWKLGKKRLSLAGKAVQVPAGGVAKAVLSVKVGDALLKWSPSAPNLSAAVVTLKSRGTAVDRRYQRFGWREFTIKGRDLLLNGERIELRGDILHPFGAYSFSTRFVRAWYTMIKDMHGNAVRPHAQIYPRCYLDIADEMGICVLDETAIFGSNLACHFLMPEFWTRWEEHYRGLVMRDRNHPSVFGWSFGNEMFAIFNLNKIPEGEQKEAWYAKMVEIGLKAREWDSTRQWISCDGDSDLNGTLPVWSKHYGHHPRDMEKEAAGVDKPLMVGENGGTYYARPADFYRLGGEEAYASYAGRNFALGVDVYSNYVSMAKGRLAYFSASETAWFGLEPLPLGYTDHTRPPNRTDGILFKDEPEGGWGMRPERMPPYVTTFNPGFDKSLPLYRPLGMFLAQKAAQDPAGPLPCHWDRYPKKPVRPAPPKDLPEGAAVDASALDDAKCAELSAVAEKGGSVLVFVSNAEGLAKANKFAGSRLTLTDRYATQFVRCSETDPAVASFTVDELYFAEAGDKDYERRQAKRCLGGAPEGSVLLEASNTDWSLFNRRGENEKVPAIICYEQMKKPEGTVLAAFPRGKGRILVTTADRSLQTVRSRHFQRRLYENLGIREQVSSGGSSAAAKDHDLLLDGPRD